MNKSNLIWMVLFAALCLVAGAVPGFAATYNLSLETTSDGSTPQTQFSTGSDIYLNIDLANSADAEYVAGCAFTLLYPADVLDSPQISTEGLPVTETDIQSSFFLFGTAQEKTRRTGSDTGQLRFSGAIIDENSGGAVTHSNTQGLFTVKFTVKSTAQAGSYSFSLTPTTLTNGSAGWSGESVPVMVGAVPASDTANYDDLSGGAFPILKNTVSASTPFSVGSCLLGDAIEGGVITAGDALKCYNAMIDSNMAFTDWGCICDVNCENGPTTADALIIYNNSGNSAPVTGFGCE